MELISVIIPVYNVRHYLRDCINSVISQSYENLEIILIDDGSTDGSGEICDYYCKLDKRINVIHQKNKGLSATRNVGLNICNGEMITFIDSDDAYLQDAILKMYEAMKLQCVDIVECGFSFYDTESKMDYIKINKNKKFCLADQGRYTKKEALRLQLNWKIAPNVWNKLYKRKIWEYLRFKEGHNFEDFDIILNILDKCNNIYILDDSLIMYRVRGGSISANKSLKNYIDKSLAYNHYYDYIDTHTPEYFNIGERETVKIRYFRLLLFCYFYCMGHKVPNKRNILGDFQYRIERIKKTIVVDNCDLLTKITLYIYMYIPSSIILGCCYYFYVFFFTLIKKMRNY